MRQNNSQVLGELVNLRIGDAEIPNDAVAGMCGKWKLFGRRVDLVDRKNLERSANRIRRDAILNSAEVVHGA